MAQRAWFITGINTGLNNAGYGLLGAAEEVTHEQIAHTVALYGTMRRHFGLFNELQLYKN